MLHEERTRAESFGEDAEKYDRARPTYPAALVDELSRRAADHRSPSEPALRRDQLTLLDVGCGTGIAARLFRSRGWTVLGLEPDRRMATVARRHGLDVEEGTFEQWDPRRRRFQLVTSAQAWHWVDPEVGPTKAADVLAEGGTIGLFWNQGSYREPVAEAFSSIYGAVAPSLAAGSIVLRPGGRTAVEAAATTLEHTGQFSDIDVATYHWRRSYTRDQWIEFLATHSDHAVLAAGVRSRLFAAISDAIEGFGGSIDVKYSTWLVSAHRGSAAPR